MQLIEPKVVPPLDADFRPAVLADKNFQLNTQLVGVRAVLGLERGAGDISRFETVVYPEGHPDFASNFSYIERIVKFLLWQRGGHTVYVGAPKAVGEHVRSVFSANGAQKFDFHFMGTQVYEKEFSVVICGADEVPAACETGKLLGRNLAGYRIGFDLGASDRKVSAVVNGEAIYSEEVIWEPRKNSDPDYHYREVMTALRTAAGKMPRVDAIGGDRKSVV